MSISRRHTTLGLFGIAALVVSRPRPASGQKDQMVSFRWTVPTSYFDSVRSDLKFEGKVEETHDTKGVPLVFIIAGIALLPTLADSIIKLRNKLVRPGLNIDTRGSEVKIEIAPELSHGMILLTDKSGSRLIDPDQITTSEELVKLLSKASVK